MSGSYLSNYSVISCGLCSAGKLQNLPLAGSVACVLLMQCACLGGSAAAASRDRAEVQLRPRGDAIGPAGLFSDSEPLF